LLHATTAITRGSSGLSPLALEPGLKVEELTPPVEQVGVIAAQGKAERECLEVRRSFDERVDAHRCGAHGRGGLEALADAAGNVGEFGAGSECGQGHGSSVSGASWRIHVREVRGPATPRWRA